MRSVLSLAAVVGALACCALAQTAIVVPNGLATVPGNTNNTFPWSRGTASMRIQFLYDPSHFTLQGVSGPVLISRLRWRTWSSTTQLTWTGGTWPNVRIDLANAATTWAAPSTTFANNLGANAMTAYQGPVTVQGGTNPPSTVGPWYIDVPLTTPFVYNPAAGDLLVDIHLDGTGWTGGSVAADHQSTGSMSSRVYNTTGLSSATGTVGTSYGAVMEVTHQPAIGLFPSFGATPRTGSSPLQVQFTDTSFSSDPAGILAWAWDVNGDGITDYTTQNPTHTYTGCGSYNVSLTVVDATGPRTLSRNNFIVTDEVTPSFTWSNLGGNVVQFTDTSTPAPTSWDWDFDGDGITDSTAQNPVWVYHPTQCNAARVRLSVSRACRGPFTTYQNLVFGPSSIGYMTGSTSTSSTTWLGGLFDVSVTHPQGVAICGVTLRPAATAVPFDVRVYVTPDSYLGKDTNAAAWRLVSTGTGPAGVTSALVALSQFYLAPGNYGMAVYIGQGGLSTSMTYNSVPTTGHPGPIADGNITLFPNPATAPGMIRTGLFGGGLLNPRIWNGTLHYSAAGSNGDAGYGFFGPGCQGALGIPGNTASSLPRLGRTMTVTLDRLPQSMAFMMLGFSNTGSPFGPLPLDLTLFGAPGCVGRVSPDAVTLVSGTGNTAPFLLGIPNNPRLALTQFYTQALSIDPFTNTLGAVPSDAVAGIIGQ